MSFYSLDHAILRGQGGLRVANVFAKAETGAGLPAPAGSRSGAERCPANRPADTITRLPSGLPVQSFPKTNPPSHNGRFDPS